MNNPEQWSRPRERSKSKLSVWWSSLMARVALSVGRIYNLPNDEAWNELIRDISDSAVREVETGNAEVQEHNQSWVEPLKDTNSDIK